jgi:hypothetical protein
VKKLFLTCLLFEVALCFSQENIRGKLSDSYAEAPANSVKFAFLQIGDLSDEENLSIYNQQSLENGAVIGRLKLNDFINIIEIAEAKIKNDYYAWLNIKTDNNISGWIFFEKDDQTGAKYFIPYFNNRWEIIETIKIRDKNWTIRKTIGQLVSVWEVLNIRDKPGLIDSKVISKIILPKSNPQVNVTVTEMTEETETIDKRTDHWLKIKYHETESWIFGGYASVERGGLNIMCRKA